MYNILVASAIVGAGLALGTVQGQARQINVWGYNFDVDSGPAPQALPSSREPGKFNATVEHPERFDFEHRRLFESDSDR